MENFGQLEVDKKQLLMKIYKSYETKVMQTTFHKFIDKIIFVIESLVHYGTNIHLKRFCEEITFSYNNFLVEKNFNIKIYRYKKNA